MSIGLNPEIRDGYQVDTARKKLWNIELEIMAEIKAVCKRHNLHYFLIGGTAIGAMRHKGFIPWDDDLDIGMLRNDFDLFMKYARDELEEKYCIQYGICGDICTALMRVRDINSTGILKSDRFSKENQGIFIEIYPFDNVPDNKWMQKKQYRLVKLYSFLVYDRYYHFQKSAAKKMIVKFFSAIPSDKLWQMLEKETRRYNNKNTKMVDTIMLPHYAEQNIHLFERLKCEKTIQVPFENTELEIAVGNDEFLRQQYGDYMKLPPIESRGTHHDNTVFYDPDKSFSQWVNTPELEKFFK